jgi:hypothetical protein
MNCRNNNAARGLHTRAKMPTTADWLTLLVTTNPNRPENQFSG